MFKIINQNHRYNINSKQGTKMILKLNILLILYLHIPSSVFFYSNFLMYMLMVTSTLIFTVHVDDNFSLKFILRNNLKDRSTNRVVSTNKLDTHYF